MAYVRKCGKIWYSQISYKWYYNKTHTLWMLNTYGYRYTLRMCNNYCFSMTKMVTYTRLIGKLYSSSLNLHKHNWLTSTPRWCYLNLLLYNYIACLVCLLLFAIYMEALHLHITIYCVLWISTYKMYLGVLPVDCAGCAAISEGYCYIDDACSVYFSVRTYILLSCSAVRAVVSLLLNTASILLR